MFTSVPCILMEVIGELLRNAVFVMILERKFFANTRYSEIISGFNSIALKTFLISLGDDMHIAPLFLQINKPCLLGITYGHNSASTFKAIHYFCRERQSYS